MINVIVRMILLFAFFLTFLEACHQENGFNSIVFLILSLLSFISYIYVSKHGIEKTLGLGK